MKVLFLTEQGEGIGYGHINRCTALADGFSEHQCDITIISRPPPGRFNPDRNYRFIHKEWNSRPYLEKVLPEFDITVVDSYKVPESTLEYIGKHAHSPVYLVDSTMRFYPAGIVLYPSAYAETEDFDRYENIDLISGIDHLLFTRELWNTRKNRINKSLRKIGISIGGIADEIVVSVVALIQKILPQSEEILVFGETEAGIRNRLNSENCKMKGFFSKKMYIKELLQLDAVISNGGQSLNESLLLGLPAISLICADNQKKNSYFWQQLGLTTTMDIRNNDREKELAGKLQKLSSYPWRKEINEKSRSLIDHKGAIRSAKRILELTA